MKPQANRPPYLAPLIVGMAVILFSTAGIARMMGWGPDSTDDSGGILSAQAGGAARAKGRCAECGVITSMREIAARDEGAGLDASGGTVSGHQDALPETSARRYEITIRLADRSSRVINYASPASWRPGERVIVIDGANPSNR
jgi:hypothetical protein